MKILKKYVFTVKAPHTTDTFSLQDLGIDENLEGEALEKAVGAAWVDWVFDNIDGSYLEEE